MLGVCTIHRWRGLFDELNNLGPKYIHLHMCILYLYMSVFVGYLHNSVLEGVFDELNNLGRKYIHVWGDIGNLITHHIIIAFMMN